MHRGGVLSRGAISGCGPTGYAAKGGKCPSALTPFVTTAAKQHKWWNEASATNLQQQRRGMSNFTPSRKLLCYGSSLAAYGFSWLKFAMRRHIFRIWLAFPTDGRMWSECIHDAQFAVGLCFSLSCVETEYLTSRDLQDAANFLYWVQWPFLMLQRFLVTSTWVFEHVFAMHTKYSKLAKIMKQEILCGFHSCAIQLRKWSGGLFKDFLQNLQVTFVHYSNVDGP